MWTWVSYAVATRARARSDGTGWSFMTVSSSFYGPPPGRAGGLGQGALDVTEVVAHGQFGGAPVAGGDRLDDGGVLGERLRRPAGHQDGAELEPDQLRP